MEIIGAQFHKSETVPKHSKYLQFASAAALSQRLHPLSNTLLHYRSILSCIHTAYSMNEKMNEAMISTMPPPRREDSCA